MKLLKLFLHFQPVFVVILHNGEELFEGDVHTQLDCFTFPSVVLFDLSYVGDGKETQSRKELTFKLNLGITFIVANRTLNRVGQLNHH